MKVLRTDNGRIYAIELDDVNDELSIEESIDKVKNQQAYMMLESGEIERLPQIVIERETVGDLTTEIIKIY